MKIIHVHVQDGEFNSTVANLLNQGYTLSTPLDVVAYPVKPEFIKRADRKAQEAFEARRNGRAAVKERIARQRAEADVFRAERDADNAMREEHFAKRAMRAEFNAQRHAEAQAALVAECSSCGAKVNEVCTKPSGKPHSGYAHIDRIRAARMVAGR